MEPFLGFGPLKLCTSIVHHLHEVHSFALILVPSHHSHYCFGALCAFQKAKKGDGALDICCGSGDLTFLVSEKVGVDGQVVGLDFSEELLSVASSHQQLKLSPCYRNIEWLEGDALDLPFPDASFDTITMGYGLRNVQDRKRALEEIFRVLKPGCRASILDFNKSTEPIGGLVQFLNCSLIGVSPTPISLASISTPKPVIFQLVEIEDHSGCF